MSARISFCGTFLFSKTRDGGENLKIAQLLFYIYTRATSPADQQAKREEKNKSAKHQHVPNISECLFSIFHHSLIYSLMFCANSTLLGLFIDR